jgi:predicted nuclease of predicted toxin-antitoxin system
MTKVLLDACIPHWLRKELSEFDVETAQFARLDRISDSELLDVISGRYDVLVTFDRNLTLQQKISGRPIGVVVLRVTEQTPETVRALIPALSEAIKNVQPGFVKIVGP